VCNATISVTFLVYAAVKQKNVPFLIQLYPHSQLLASLLGPVTEACLLKDFALAVLAVAEGSLTWVSNVVSAAADAADKCWDEPAVQLIMFWLTIEWAGKQSSDPFQQALLSTCADDLQAMVENYPKSQLMHRLLAVATHNLKITSTY